MQTVRKYEKRDRVRLLGIAYRTLPNIVGVGYLSILGIKIGYHVPYRDPWVRYIWV